MFAHATLVWALSTGHNYAVTQLELDAIGQHVNDVLAESARSSADVDRVRIEALRAVEASKRQLADFDMQQERVRKAVEELRARRLKQVPPK